MIQTEKIMKDGIEFTHTYSDKGMYIERDGIEYADAIDPSRFGRTYSETNIPIEQDESTAEEIVDILTGESE